MEKFLELLSNKLIISLIIIIFTFIVMKLIKVIFNKINKTKKIHLSFFKYFIQAIIIVISFYFIGHNFKIFEEFSSTILASSSLLVVVLGFAFQEGLSTIIHGIIISVFHPFEIGDRIRIEEKNITGIVENITLRHTVVKNIMTSALIKIPNDIMDKAIIENFQNGTKEIHTNFLDVTICYEDNIDLAMEIIKETIINHPLNIDTRTKKEKNENKPQVSVLIREFSQTGIVLRASSVTTKTISDNFLVCSDIRKSLIKKFKENNIHFAYNKSIVNGDISIDLPYIEND
jgi:small-conductance mechanosensitive channel